KIEKKELEVAPPPGETIPGKPAVLPLTAKAAPAATAKKVLPPESRMPSRKTVEAAWNTLNEFNALLAATRPQGARGVEHSVYHAITSTADTAPQAEAVQTASAVMPASSVVMPASPAVMPSVTP